MQGKWTAAIDDYLSGTAIKWVLLNHGISKTHFYRVIRQLGIEKRGPRERFLPEEVEDIVASYRRGEHVKNIAERYHSADSTISTVLTDAGVRLRTKSEIARVFSDEQIAATIENYKNGLTAKAAGKLCGASEPSVLRWLKDHNVPARHQADYGGNDDYFDVLDTDEKCYWFGFLAADGRAKKKFLTINLGMKDWNHIETFKSHVGYTGPIVPVTRFHRIRQKWYTHANFNWGSVKIVADLQKHGILQIKAGDCEPLIRLNDDQYRSFLRGYFDGDGSIYVTSRRGDWYWNICGPHPAILEYLMSRCPVVTRHNAIEGATRWAVAYGGNKIVPKICNWLYAGSTICLPRKLERARSCTK